MTKLFKDKSDEKKLLPIIVVWVALTLAEIWKIFYLITIDGEFRPLRYPFVFCSIVLYTFPLFCFKQNKLSNVAKSLSVIPSIAAFILFEAVQVSYPMNLMQAHSYFFHSSMVTVAIYLLTVRLYRFKFNDFFSLSVSLGLYVAFCVCVSLFIGADISIFGPQSGNLAIVYNNFGYVPGNIILIILVFLLLFGFHSLMRAISQNEKKPRRSKYV
jgi:hypothetical protein